MDQILQYNSWNDQREKMRSSIPTGAVTKHCPKSYALLPNIQSSAKTNSLSVTAGHCHARIVRNANLNIWVLHFGLKFNNRINSINGHFPFISLFGWVLNVNKLLNILLGPFLVWRRGSWTKLLLIKTFGEYVLQKK